MMPTRILVVDDEPPIVDVLVYNLERANYEVLVARDGQDALVQARREQPDLIIPDLMLPLSWPNIRIRSLASGFPFHHPKGLLILNG
jgi:CheY-like chemotaxis protein